MICARSRGVLWALLALAALAVPVWAGISSRNLARTERTHSFRFSPIGYTQIAGSTPAGTRNVVFSHVNFAGDTQFTATSSLAGTEAAFRLQVKFYDEGAASTPSCSSVQIAGRDQFGRDVYETMSVTEAIQYTSNVYEEVEYLHAAGCSGHDASDDFIVAGTVLVGLQRDLADASQVISLCVETFGVTPVKSCFSGAQLAETYSSAFDFEKDTFNVETFNSLVTPTLRFAMLSSAGVLRVRNPLRTP